MDLLQLQYFRTIAKLENLTKASELLFVAQPNLSVSISRLEADLGVPLFDRRKGRITLTPTGRVFLEHVERVLYELESGVDHVRDIEDAVKNQIRVAGSIIDLMSDILLQFYPENKDVSIKQLNCPNAHISQKVLSDEVDLGFVYGTPPTEGLEYSLLDSCERVLMVNENHQLASVGYANLRDLSGERFICSYARDDDVFFKEIGPQTGFRPRIHFECDAMQIETSLVATGMGIMIVPVAHYLKLLRADPELPIKCIRIRDPLPEAQLGVVRRQGSILTDASLRFYNHIDRFFQIEDTRIDSFLKEL